MEKPKQIILGWKEWVGMPEFGIEAIKAKVCTANDITILHTCYMELYDKEGEIWTHFGVHPSPKSIADLVNCSAKVVRFETDSDTDADTEDEQQKDYPVVISTIEIKGNTYPVELALKPYRDSIFCLLLGNQLLRHNFIVDVGKTYLQGKPA